MPASKQEVSWNIYCNFVIKTLKIWKYVYIPLFFLMEFRDMPRNDAKKDEIKKLSYFLWGYLNN